MFTEKIYVYRDKESNWGTAEKAERLGYKNASDLRYLCSEIELVVQISDTGRPKILKIEGIDVSDKGIYV